jgi:membrane protein
VWDNSGEDNVLFLASGIAFNLILAAVPFILLLAAGVATILPLVYRHGDQINSAQTVGEFIDTLLPAHNHGANSPVDKMISDLLRNSGSIGLYSALLFVWFSTRLFGSLRTVLASVFDIESERGIIAGKIFDVKITVVSTLLFAASVTLSAYITLATTSGANALVAFGLRTDVMHSLEAWTGQGLALSFIALMFFALYKYLPIRRVRAKTAWIASAFTTLAFEGARIAFEYYAKTFNPGSLYRGTLTVAAVVIIWFYYAAVIFILGGEVGQVFELRRVRRLQREVFVD